MSKNFIVIYRYFYLFLLVFFLLPQSVLANEAIDNLVSVGTATGLNTNQTPTGIVVRTINAILGLVGAIFIIFIIWAGFKWMTSQGNADQVKKAKETILNSVIGLAVIIASYVITFTIMNVLITGTLGDSGGMGGTP